MAVAYAVYARFRTFIAPLSTTRAQLAAAASYFVSHSLGQAGRLQTLIAGVLGMLTYVSVLVASREPTRAGFAAVLRIARRRRSWPPYSYLLARRVLRYAAQSRFEEKV